MNEFNILSTFFVNDVSAYVPQLWANESLMILQENMVAASLVHRDFSPLVSDFGDTVNTRRPAKFVGVRKGADDNVTTQNATATNVAVVLNQCVHVSFVIKDLQASLAFKDLVAEFLRPAMIAQAKFVDQTILGLYPYFLGNQVGQIGGLSTAANVRSYMLAARQIMNTNLAPEDPRRLMLTSVSETAALNTDLFTEANRLGDGGNALKNAVLGRKLGFDTYMSQNTPSVSTSATNPIAGTGVVNNASGYPVGTTTLTISGFTAAIPAGAWISIDNRPYRVVSSVGGATPTSVTIVSPGLVASVANGASLQVSAAGAVNLSAGYAAGWVGSIIYSGFTNPPSAGQMVTFGTSSTSATYTIIQVDTANSTITLDRPLEASVANSTTINVGPAGQFNLAFHPNAIALVSRPLALPPAGLGARAAVVNYNNVSMRALMAYDAVAQGTRVTLDMLFGVKVLDTNLGAVMLG